MPAVKKYYGTLSTGEDVHLYALEAGEFKACWCDYGATWNSFVMPDSKGVKDDVLLGFSTFGPYTGEQPYMGATVGRFANRIARASFSLEGTTYPLWVNNGPNHLHGGRRGYSKRLWEGEIDNISGDPAARFTLHSPDGEEGYPGNLDIVVTVSLSAAGELSISYEAESDRLTPVNLTNHAYFNLAGEGSGTILNHELELRCSAYLPVDATLIPLPGHPMKVSGTPFDFRTVKRIGADIGDSLSGYDHCFVIDDSVDGAKAEPFAVVKEYSRGRILTASTTSPAVQFYTGNFLNGIQGKRGSVYGKHSGFCLETQYYPDSPNREDFPPCWAKPGKKWEQTTKYHFSVI